VGSTIRPGAQESSVCIGPFDRSAEARTIFTNRTDVTQFRSWAWLPDGSAVVVQRGTAQGPRLFVAPVERAPDATEDLVPLFATDSDCKQPAISFDGSLVAYVSTESGGPEVYVRAFEKGTIGPPIRASRAGGIKPIWSGDNKTLYFSTPGHGTALMVHVTKTPALAVSALEPSPLSQNRLESLDVLEYIAVPGAVHPFLAVQRGADERPAERFDVIFNFFDVLNEKAPRLH
jgi:serine/threonine-protein kinase